MWIREDSGEITRCVLGIFEVDRIDLADRILEPLEPWLAFHVAIDKNQLMRGIAFQDALR